MPSPLRNAIDWNRRAIRRAEGRLRRASNENQRLDAENDIARFEDNIRLLEAQA